MKIKPLCLDVNGSLNILNENNSIFDGNMTNRLDLILQLAFSHAISLIINNDFR